MRNWSGIWMVAGLGIAAYAGACAPEQAADEPMEMDAEMEMDAPDEIRSADPGLLDANEATAEQLASIMGLGAATAEAILAARPFDRVADLHAVVSAHVAEDGLDAVYSRLWVPIDLNTATADEILLIPGVGDRMLHEFEEYRPYDSMAQFRREIGKYVDDEELERLAQYVDVR